MPSQSNAIKTSIIFPAFVPEYTGLERLSIQDYEDDFISLLSQASDLLGINLTGFDFMSNNFTDDEEKSQYISYIFSCTVADFLSKHDVRPALVSAYSMGIYAALCYCGAISFKDGLWLVKTAWESILASTPLGEYGMGMIVGLSKSDINSLIGDDKEVSICNRNNPHTYIISGNLTGISRILDRARNEGALRSDPLPVSKPYHSGILKDAIPGFSRFLAKTSFTNPTIPYVSSLDQRILITASDLKQELINNLYHPMNWMLTMKMMINSGVEVFFECGAGDGLTRNIRFIDKTVKAYSVDKLGIFLDQSGYSITLR